MRFLKRLQTDGPRRVYEDEAGQFTHDDLGEKIHSARYVLQDEVEFADVPNATTLRNIAALLELGINVQGASGSPI
jgi:hypothetical protein